MCVAGDNAWNRMPMGAVDGNWPVVCLARQFINLHKDRSLSDWETRQG